MPSNGPAENVLYGLKGIPLFTYGMIGITTLVLAYITFTDVTIENPLDTINPVSELQQPVTSEEPTTASESEPTSSGVPAAPFQEPSAPFENMMNAQETEPVVEAVPIQEDQPVEKIDQSQEIPKTGGKKRTIRNKEKKRRTIRK
jgi:hypothetical protein